MIAGNGVDALNTGFSVTQIVATIRSLDGDELEKMLNQRELLRGTAPSPEMDRLNEDMITRLRLVLQWRNQIREQTRSKDEMLPDILRSAAQMIEGKENV